MNKDKLSTIWKYIKLAGNSLLVATVIVLAIPFLPFYGLYKLFQHIYRKLVTKFGTKKYDFEHERWISRDEHEKDMLRKRIKSGKVKIETLPHVTEHPFIKFHVHFKKVKKMPTNVLVYVETIPNEKIAYFFRHDHLWVDDFSAKYGFRIVKLKVDEIRKVMFFPHDAKELRHGIIWNCPYTGRDTEYGVEGYEYYYFDIDPDKPFRNQFEDIADKIYSSVIH